MKSLHVDLLAESWLNGGLRNFNRGSTAVQPDAQPNTNQDYPEGLTSEDQKTWDKIKHKWFLQDGMWFNAKLEGVREKRKIFLKRQSDKGKASAEARAKNKKLSKKPHSNRGSTAVEPIEKEKENELEIEVSKYPHYSAEMRTKFLRYWTEKNSKGKQRWKLQDTWETGKRLATWHENNLNRNPPKAGTKPVEPQTVTGQIKF